MVLSTVFLCPFLGFRKERCFMEKNINNWLEDKELNKKLMIMEEMNE
jgi:hypothetical protein